MVARAWRPTLLSASLVTACRCSPTSAEIDVLDRPFEGHLDGEARHPFELAHQEEQLGADACAGLDDPEPVDRGPDLGDRRIDLRDGVTQAVLDLGASPRARQALEGEADGEQVLDDGVVEVPGDPVAVLEDALSCGPAWRRAFSMAIPAPTASALTRSSSSLVNSDHPILSVKYRLPYTSSCEVTGTPRKDFIGG